MLLVAPPFNPESMAKEFKNSTGMEFVIVPKGKSWLGGGKDKLGDKEVVIPADFYLGKYEVTQEEWEKVMGENPSWFSRTGERKDAVKDISDQDLKRFPVETVSWHDCQLFLERLNKLKKESGWVYRLPTELEWEYACRGGPMAAKADSAFDFYFAKPTNDLLAEQSNFGHGNGLTRACKVGSYKPNALGLFDMHGNVWEWCDDARRVNDAYRGGAWDGDISYLKTARRNSNEDPAGLRTPTIGFRVALVSSGALSPEVKTPPQDADRRAAEYVLSIGGSVSVNDQPQDQVIQATTELPRESFRLTAAILMSNKQVNDVGLGHFKDCKNLTFLHLMHTTVGDVGLAHFKDCKNLRKVFLGGTQVTDAGLAYFKDCKNLDALSLGNTKVTDTGLGHFKDCKNLMHLHLMETQVTDAGLVNFKDCKNLLMLFLGGTQITDAGTAKT